MESKKVGVFEYANTKSDATLKLIKTSIAVAKRKAKMIQNENLYFFRVLLNQLAHRTHYPGFLEFFFHHTLP
jgi:hypothetical protein